MRTFHIRAGTAVEVRKAGTLGWKPFTTTKPLTFDRYTVCAAFWMFEHDGWELRALPDRVARREVKPVAEAAPPPPPPGVQAAAPVAGQGEGGEPQPRRPHGEGVEEPRTVTG